MLEIVGFGGSKSAGVFPARPLAYFAGPRLAFLQGVKGGAPGFFGQGSGRKGVSGPVNPKP